LFVLSLVLDCLWSRSRIKFETERLSSTIEVLRTKCDIFFYKVTRCFYVAIIQSFDDRMCMNTQWRGRGRDRAAAQGGTLQEATFEGRKFGILAFALQCVSVSLYLFLIYCEGVRRFGVLLLVVLMC